MSDIPPADTPPADNLAADSLAAGPAATSREARLQWDDSTMSTSFANVVNIQSSREQVDLFFGTNRTWNPADEATLSIVLSNRMILSPFAAKRLSLALAGVLREYEARYGAIDI